ncbi:MAG: Cell division coordinator CpoB [Mycoplasmataceae bacterium]|nr:MAG: Cell division coordinator CpoB [Mycoplasmataceae bacterium]
MKKNKDTKRCILCEKKEKLEKFQLSQQHGGNCCDNCWNGNNNDFLHDYEWNFNYDLFYLKYPEEKPDDWGEIDIDASLSKLENELSRNKEILPRRIALSQENDELKGRVQEMKNNMARLEKEIKELKKFKK